MNYSTIHFHSSWSWDINSKSFIRIESKWEANYTSLKGDDSIEEDEDDSQEVGLVIGEPFKPLIKLLGSLEGATA